MVRSADLTIAWDAATINGIHVNEIHVCSAEGMHSLTTGALAGGKTDDYVGHIVDSIRHAAHIYAAYYELQSTSIFKDLASKFQCTLSDRASVNPCVSQRLSMELEVELVELNCNLHPLECVATASREVLVEHEKKLMGPDEKRSNTFGKMAGAVNLISAISKLRYKDGKGDPCGFKSFLKEKRIDGRLLVRYVGNRLHSLFLLAGSVFHLRTDLLVYLKRCSQQALRLAILGDLHNEVILVHLQVLGLFGKLVTGPWMTELYTSDQEHQHLQLTESLKVCLNFTLLCSHTPSLLFSSDTNAFGKKLSDCSVLIPLRAQGPSAMFNEVASLVAKRVHERTSRQLERYISGPLVLSSELVDKTASAPVHNMYAERALGMVDALLRRAPNASVGTVDARVRARLNKTLDWLELQCEQNELISFARKHEAKVRKMQLSLKRRLEDKILVRQQERGQEREMKERRKLEKEVLRGLSSGSISLEFLERVGDEGRKFIENLQSGLCVGVVFKHVWSTADGRDDIYLACVRKQKKEKVRKIIIGYWKEEEQVSDAVDFTMSLHSLIADVILGDIVLFNQ